MPVDGGSRGPGSNKGVSARQFKGDGPGANRKDGAPAGGRHFAAAGLTHGRPDDLRNGSPNRGPSMGGVLKYIRDKKDREEKAPGSGGSAMPSGAAAGMDSPLPTGGEPHEEFNEGNDIPGESHEEKDQDESDCGHPGCTAHSKSGLRYSQSNREQMQPAKGRK